MATKTNIVRPCSKAADLTTRLLILAAAIAFGPAQVFGIGARIPNQDASAIARGNAFVATADNPSAIYYNPAGITQLEGQNLLVGDLNYMGINTHYDSPVGTDSDTKYEVTPVPQVYYTYTPKDCPLSLGLGVYAPFGLGVQWPQNTGFRSLAIETRLQYITVNPVIAWKVHPKLSIAIGPTFNYSQLEVTRGLATPTDLFRFKGNDFAFGFNAGLLWQLDPKWAFGANYRAATTMDYSGNSTYNPGVTIPPADTTASIDFPQIVCFGVSYRPTPKWNLEVDVDYTDWNSLNTVVLKGTSNLGFPSDLPFELNWHESWFYEFGVTRYFDNGWYASAGYFYCSETTPSQYFTPAVPDTALHVGSLGVGHKGERWSWAFAAQIIAGPTRDVNNSQPNPFTGESADGSYQLFIPTLTFSAGYRF